MKSLSLHANILVTQILYFLTATLLYENYWCQGLKITLLDIPSPLVVGQSAELTCNYDLEDNVLYSFKWYKDGIEFYRYVPRDYPPTQYLKMSGINVEVHKSSKRSVFLKEVNLSTRGKYRCEISAEAPSFMTAAKEGQLEINVLPMRGPTITTDQTKYTVGDEIVANCTSDRTNLDTILNFTINGEPILNSIDYELRYSTQLHSDTLKTAGVSLRFMLTSKHFRQGRMKLKCDASVPLYHILNDAERVIEDFNFRPEPVQYYSSGESQARSRVTDEMERHVSSMNAVKSVYVFFTIFMHYQFQQLFH